MTRQLLAVLLLGLSSTGCGDTASGQHSSRPDGRLVLVSGRDDHGLVAMDRVPLYAGPGSDDQVGTVPDGTLANAAETEGTWLHVVSAEGAPVDGWVDDFHLRGVVHLVGPPPSCRALVGGRPVPAGLQVIVQQLRGDRVLISGFADPAMRGWASRADVQELAPQPPGCGEDPAGSDHHHE